MKFIFEKKNILWVLFATLIVSKELFVFDEEKIVALSIITFFIYIYINLSVMIRSEYSLRLLNIKSAVLENISNYKRGLKSLSILLLNFYHIDVFVQNISIYFINKINTIIFAKDNLRFDIIYNLTKRLLNNLLREYIMLSKFFTKLLLNFIIRENLKRLKVKRSDSLKLFIENSFLKYKNKMKERLIDPLKLEIIPVSKTKTRAKSSKKSKKNKGDLK